MKSKYMFSVVIATKNRKEYLQKAIESACAQEEVTIQIIVVDDASDDGTEEFIRLLQDKYGYISYIKNEVSIFAHKSRQKGYQIAQGQYVVFMDDDDYYSDTKFYKKTHDIFAKYETVSAVLGATTICENGICGKVIDLGGMGVVDSKSYINGFGIEYPKPSSTLSAIFRKSSLDELCFSESGMINDTCIYLYGILGGDVYLLNECVAIYRVHSNNISGGKFEKEFIFDNLNEKIKLYEIARKNNKLYDAKQWLYNQLYPTMCYFATKTDKKARYYLTVGWWLLFRGKGTQIIFLRGFIKYIFKVK